MPIIQRKKRKPPKSVLLQRTRDMFNNHTRFLNVDAFGKDHKTPKEKQLALPYSLEWLRLKADEALHDFDKSCPYCDEPLTVKNLSLEHPIPTSRRDEFAKLLEGFKPVAEHLAFDEFNTDRDRFALLLAAYSWENTTFCCKRCNIRKGPMTVDEWKKLRALVLSLSVVAQQHIMSKLSSVPFKFWLKDAKKKQKGGGDEEF